MMLLNVLPYMTVFALPVMFPPQDVSTSLAIGKLIVPFVDIVSASTLIACWKRGPRTMLVTETITQTAAGSELVSGLAFTAA